MDLQQIKYFLAVVDCNTFMAAAERVHVSQPTLSAGIRKLEDSLQTPLFYRGSRAATLTPAGELFLTSARPAYDQLIAAKATLSGEEQTIRIGVLNTVPLDHITHLFTLFRVSHPGVLIDLVVANDKKLSRLLTSGKIDIAFTAAYKKQKRLLHLFDEALMLVTPSRHPLANVNVARLDTIANQSFVERIHCESWQAVQSAFKQYAINPKIVCKAESDEVVLALVAGNMGVSIMPRRETPYAVSFVKIAELDTVRHIGIELSGRKKTEYIEAFIELARKHYAS